MADSQSISVVKSEPSEDMGAPSSVATPLTRLSLSALKPAMKRKRQVTEAETDAVKPENDNEGESGNQPVQYAPAKKNRRKREKTLSTTVGIPTISRYKSSKAYTGSRSNKDEYSPSDLNDLQYAVYLIGKGIDIIDNGSEMRWNELRTLLHRVEVETNFDNDALIQKSKILEPDALPRLFSGEFEDRVPWDIAVDSSVLFKQWKKGDRDSSLLRDISIEKKVKGIYYKLDDNSDKISAHAIGENGLVNGQWWPMRLCAFRDGAHGEREAGIHGKAGLGVYSVVVSSGGYADKDFGDVIHYCGTASETPTPTSRTSFLRTTVGRHSIRVLRGVNKKSVYAPAEGLRYDGLYNVVSEELLNADTAMYRFKLERVPRQDPIRYKGPEKRPTKQQLDEKVRVWSTFARSV